MSGIAYAAVSLLPSITLNAERKLEDIMPPWLLLSMKIESTKNSRRPSEDGATRRRMLRNNIICAPHTHI